MRIINLFKKAKVVSMTASVLMLAGTVMAQPSTDKGSKSPSPMGQLPPGRTLGAPSKPVESYPDSVEFKAQWKQLYPLIRPSKSIRDRFITQFNSQGNIHTMKTRQVDSAEAYKKVMEVLDTTMMEQSYFRAWRKEFTAEELKQIVPFIKTPAGKRLMEVGTSVTTGVNSTIDGYVRGTMMRTITPMQKPLPAGESSNNPEGRMRGMQRDSLGRVIPQSSPKIQRDSLGRPIYPNKSGMMKRDTGAWPSGTPDIKK